MIKGIPEAIGPVGFILPPTAGSQLWADTIRATDHHTLGKQARHRALNRSCTTAGDRHQRHHEGPVRPGRRAVPDLLLQRPSRQRHHAHRRERRADGQERASHLRPPGEDGPAVRQSAPAPDPRPLEASRGLLVLGFVLIAGVVIGPLEDTPADTVPPRDAVPAS